MRWIFIAVALLSGCNPEPINLTSANARVVIASDAPKTVRFAADELTNFLAQALGGDIAMGSEPERGKVNLILGTNRWSAAEGIRPQDLKRDSFVFRSANGNDGSAAIFIAGCDDPDWDIRQAWNDGDTGESRSPFERATLFGVYDFLERYAGCRFYFYGPLGTIVPRRNSLEIPVGERVESPDFIRRVWYSPGGELMEGEDLGVGWKRGDKRRVGFIQFMRLRRFSGTPFVHSVRHMSLKERFGKTHPEYFYATRTKDGKLVRHTDPKERYTHICWSSGVLDEIYRDWVAFAKGESPESRGIRCDRVGGAGVWPRHAYGAGVVGFMPDDGFCACECDECRAGYGTDRRDPGSSYASKLVWSKTAELANRLKRDGIPLLVQQCAYTSVLKRPEGMTLPDNVVVGVSCTGPWAERSPERRDADLANVKDWSEAAGGAKVFLHNWAMKYSRTNIADLPCWTPRSVGSYYARVGPWAQGVYMESSSDRYSHVFLNAYILAKMTWNTRFDYNAAIDEHYDLMYGSAAPEMKAFFDELEDYWIDRITAGKVEYNALGPIQRVPTKFEIWRSIYTAEKLSEWGRLFEAAAKKVSAGSLEARRIELMRRNVLEPVMRAREDFAASTDASREEERRRREGVKNLLDREYGCDFRRTDAEAAAEHKKPDPSLRIPFRFEPNTAYRLSFFLEAEDVKPLARYPFCGALVGIWSEVPKRWNFSFGTGAVVGSTEGRVHQSMILKTPKEFEAKAISVWLRNATGHMKVDGLVLEKIH